ncbi:MAG: acyl-CoA dehydrogenase [Salinibacterium sp.]|nr:acyl-CoA dehydrogenase [Salinibacterium sp.]MBF0673368.1 acyl-CoA dehydrogenase [Salinibacterium sp.]
MTTILGISEERADLREMLWDLLSQQSSPEQVHRIVDSGDANDPSLDAALAELGLVGIDAPEDLGGGGGGVSHLRHVAEGCGWSTAATRLLGTSAAMGALLASDATDAREQWVPRLADGSAAGAVALPGVFGGDRGDHVTAQYDNGSLRLSGTVSNIVDLPVASIAVVLAHTEEGRAALALVELDSPGATVARLEALDLTRTIGSLELDGARATLLAGADAASAAVEAIVQRASLVLAADSLGIAARVVEVTVEYAKQREQFDRPIGSFQAVKHQAADMLTRTEMARALVDEAAHALEESRSDAALLVSMAKDLACGTSAWVAGRGIQLHGGIGYTWEHEMHIYFKRAKLNEMLFGDRRWHRGRIIELTRAQRGNHEEKH